MRANHLQPERFWERVTPEPNTGCWLWTASATVHGYGYVRWHSRSTRAHRVAWEIARGPIPDGLHVLHRCDQRTCCNPSHLFLGTNSENVADKVSKGRQARAGADTWRNKTHCPAGHPYAGENLIVYRGMRYCRTCQRAHSKAYYARRRAA